MLFQRNTEPKDCQATPTPLLLRSLGFPSFCLTFSSVNRHIIDTSIFGSSGVCTFKVITDGAGDFPCLGSETPHQSLLLLPGTWSSVKEKKPVGRNIGVSM